MPATKIPAAKDTFGRALRTVRVAKEKTQEDFVHASSRTHISMLERGVNAPNLATIEALALELRVHPLTIVALTYSKAPSLDAVEQLLDLIRSEVSRLGVAEFALTNRRRKPLAGKVVSPKES